MKITVTVDQQTICDLIRKHVQAQVGEAMIGEVRLLVKSKQNYRAEWEPAGVLVTNDAETPEWVQAEQTRLKAVAESK